MQKLVWQHYDACHLTDQPPEELIDWLLDPGSFIKRLKQQGVQQPHVYVLSQRWQCPSFDERKLLGIAERHVALVREVLIGSGNDQWMFARTVFPAATLTGSERRLAHLKNRSLGSVLFKNPHVLRSDFELACINPGMDWHEKIRQVASVDKHVLWARRSQFFIKQKSLLLMEVFLPAMNKLTR